MVHLNSVHGYGSILVCVSVCVFVCLFVWVCVLKVHLKLSQYLYKCIHLPLSAYNLTFTVVLKRKYEQMISKQLNVWHNSSFCSWSTIIHPLFFNTFLFIFSYLFRLGKGSSLLRSVRKGFRIG